MSAASTAGARIVVLDDWEQALGRLGDWSAIRQRAEVRIHTRPLSGDALSAALADADVVVLNRDRTPFDAALIERLPRLRYVIHTGPRNRRLDHAALERRGVPVSSTEGGPAQDTTCEHTWALILGLIRQLEPAAALMRGGGWRPAQATALPAALHGETLGLVGCGHIGARVAAVGRAFGMRVLTWSPHMTPERAAACGAQAVSLEELLRVSLVISVHLVPSEATRHLLNRERFELMRRDAVLVNTARAELVDPEALLMALEQGRIAGAALDVYPCEPLPADHPLRRMPQVLLTPHTGFLSEAAAGAFARGVTEAVMAWLDGQPLPRVVQPVGVG